MFADDTVFTRPILFFSPLSPTLWPRFERHRTRDWTAMSSKMQSSSSLAHHKRVVQQLRREACIDRIKVAGLASVFRIDFS